MGKTVLVVEDNHDDQLFVLANLKKREHYTVTCVSDGAAALKYLEGNPQPAVIILDLSLPKISGLDVLLQIRALEKTRFIPVVVLSSSKEMVDIHRAYALGCNSYLYKPIVYEDFRALINQVADYWCLGNISFYEDGSLTEARQEEGKWP